MEKWSLSIAGAAFVVSLAAFIIPYVWQRKKTTVEAYKELKKDIYPLYEYKGKELELYLDGCSEEEYAALTAMLSSIELFAVCVFNNTYERRLSKALAKDYLGVVLKNNIETLYEYKLEKSKIDYYPYTRKFMDML